MVPVPKIVHTIPFMFPFVFSFKLLLCYIFPSHDIWRLHIICFPREVLLFANCKSSFFVIPSPPLSLISLKIYLLVKIVFYILYFLPYFSFFSLFTSILLFCSALANSHFSTQTFFSLKKISPQFIQPKWTRFFEQKTKIAGRHPPLFSFD